MKLVKLYRPIGLIEYELIKEKEFKEFPPRLAHQPIFYPVLNLEYAIQIARDWNTKDINSGFCGFVVEFEIREDEYLKYEIQTVGSNLHQELWIPASELSSFNSAIVGKLKIVAEYCEEG